MITKTFGGTYLTLSEHPDSNCRVVKILESGTGEKHLNPDLPLSGLAISKLIELFWILDTFTSKMKVSCVVIFNILTPKEVLKPWHM